MPQKSKQARIRELENELSMYKEFLEKTNERNRELVDAEEGTFLHSPTYLQMKEQLRFLENLVKLDESHLAEQKKAAKKADSAFLQVYEDNKRLLAAHTDIDYFIGITENWHNALEYKKISERIIELEAKTEQMELFIADRDKEIERLHIILSEKQMKEEKF